MECCVIRLQPGKQLLQKKSHGQLIHISDFINEQDGWLIRRNEEGEIIKDVIYPGSHGDAW